MRNNNSKSTSLNPFEILGHAEEFNKAAQQLRGNDELKQYAVRTPSHVCAVFAFELYLKYLIFTDSNNVDDLNKEKHNVYKLFYNKIRSEYREEITKNVIAEIDSPEFTEKKLKKRLKKLKGSFVIWRYVYEYDHVQFTNLFHILADVSSAICKKIESAKWQTNGLK